MICLFVLDDSLTIWRINMRAEQQTQCCKPLQKMSVKLGPCKMNLSSPVIVYYWSFQGDTSVVNLFVYVLVLNFGAV